MQAFLRSVTGEMNEFGGGRPSVDEGPQVVRAVAAMCLLATSTAVHAAKQASKHASNTSLPAQATPPSPTNAAGSSLFKRTSSGKGGGSGDVHLDVPQYADVHKVCVGERA